MYHFMHLPDFARKLHAEWLAEFSALQIQLSQELQLPLLRHLRHLSDEQLQQLTQASAAELLQHLADQKAQAYIESSIRRWLANELRYMEYADVLVEDITVLNHVRAQALQHFIPRYTSDLAVAVALAREIDRLLMGYSTSSLTTFIGLLREQIMRQQAQLLEAESIAHLGSFDWNILANTTNSSPEMRKIMESEEPIGPEHFLEQVHPDDSQVLRSALAEAFVNGTLACEFRFRTPKGEKTLWARGIVYQLEGQPSRMIGVIQDISDRKRMEETLLLKTLELERSNEELQQFASVASHDLKEPLRKIVLYTDLLESEAAGALSEQSRQHLGRVKDAARRMRMLIEDILAFSSLNQQQEPQPTALEKLLGEVREVLESRIRETGARVETDGLPEAFVIPFQFRQLFQNLLSNALKFVHPGQAPQVRIRHRWLESLEIARHHLPPASRYLELEFSDNGIGFAPHYAEKIFGLFNRLHNRTRFEGTGLGLAICRKVAENHGGRIEASSAPGAGARFRVYLPQ